MSMCLWQALKERENRLAIVGFVILSALTFGINGAMTGMSVKTWYMTLTKPWFTPPNYMFPIAWTTIYVLFVFIGWKLWKQPLEDPKLYPKTSAALGLLMVQFLLQILWNALFFVMHQITPAFYVMVTLWVVMLVSTMFYYKLSKCVAYLMAPYVLWLSYATILMGTIWEANP